MHGKQPLGSAIDSIGPSKGRDLAYARQEATDSLSRFVRLLREWNDPDDDYTRYQLRSMLDSVIEAEFSK